MVPLTSLFNKTIFSCADTSFKERHASFTNLLNQPAGHFYKRNLIEIEYQKQKSALFIQKSTKKKKNQKYDATSLMRP